VRIGFGQFRPRFGDVTTNIEQSVELIRSVRCDLIVLPELCTSGYNFASIDEVRDLAEAAPDGPSCTAWRDVARETGCTVVGGFAEMGGDELYNSCALVRPDGTLHVYRKVHLFDREKKWFRPGDTFAVHRVGSANVGLMICFDWIFPESARTLAVAGADILCHPANLVLPWCGRAMVTRCVENRVFAITANRWGSEDRHGHSLTFTGGSQIVAPDGTVLARAEQTGDCAMVVEIDPAVGRDKAINEYNDLMADRRPECYGLLGRAGKVNA